MDNASKALIIVGAILVSMLIVSLAIFMFNSSNTITDVSSEKIDNEIVTNFNSSFEKWFGEGKSREQAKAVARYAKISNARSDVIVLCPEPTAFDGDAANAEYTIKGVYGADGYLSQIIIN